MIKETITFTFENETQQRRFHMILRRRLSDKETVTDWAASPTAKDVICLARKQGTAGGNDPADCDWPICGCDDYASHVMFSLHEQGWRSPAEVQEYARKTREQVVREFEADSK